MANKKISELTSKATPVAADIIPILDSEASNANKRTTVGGAVDTRLGAYATKATPVAADQLVLIDSAASSAPKRSTLTAIVAYLRTVLVPILSLFFGWVSVKDYAATGDGTTDDTAAIAAAITAAGTNGVVYFPPGTYNLTATLTPLAGQTIELAGGAKLLLPTTANGFTLSADDVTIRGGEMDGRRSTYSPTAGTGLNASAVTGARCTIERCYIHDTGNNAVYGNACPDLTIRHCRFINEATAEAGQLGYVHQGIFLQGSNTSRARIEGNYISGWSQGIGLWFGPNNCVVAYNRLVNNYGYQDTAASLGAHTTPRSACEDYGDTVVAHGQNLWIGNVIVGTTLNGLEIGQGTRGSRFIGNYVERAGRGPSATTGRVFVVQGSGGNYSEDILLHGNTFVGVGDRQDGGLLTGQVGNVVIQGNYFNGFSYSAAGTPGAVNVAGGGGGGSTIANNTFNACYRCVVVTVSSEATRILNNLARASTNVAIRVESGAEHLIQGNHLDTGITVASTAGAGTRIRDNNLMANAAIDVNAAATVIEGNVCAGAASGGSGTILLQSSALRSIVRRNRVSSGMGRAIALFASVDYLIVQDNDILTGSIFLPGTEGTHNTLEPNNSATITKALTPRLLAAQTINSTQTTIAHTLGYTPTQVTWQMTTTGNIWRSAVADGTNVYLTADANGRIADLYVR